MGNHTGFFHVSALSEDQQTLTVAGPSVSWETLERFDIANRTLKSHQLNPTCGKILTHCRAQVSAFRKSLGQELCIFKIGVTADPLVRFQDYMDKAYTNMWIVHVSDDLGLTHMLEAALISEFHLESGCRNSPGTGGEGGLNRKKHLGPPFYTYVTGGRADQFKRVG